MMAVYYNENDAFCTEWLGNLTDAGHLPAGRIDGRSIKDVRPEDLDGVKEAHFFAGIGGWPLALRLAGWPADREVWTGSCPCQPFSVAGKQRGTADERHLWPVWRDLIAKRRPATVFGEQVASRVGRAWLAGVRVDLEALGYAVGAADLCAASVGAPHIRQRLYWVGHTLDTRLEGHARDGGDGREPGRVDPVAPGSTAASSLRGRMAEVPDVERRRGRLDGDTPRDDGEVQTQRLRDLGEWGRHTAVLCGDGTTRRIPIEPEFFPVAPRLPGHVGRLRAYGNAIVPPLAAEFVKAFMAASSKERPYA